MSKRRSRQRKNQFNSLRKRLLLVGIFALSALLLPNLNARAAGLTSTSVAIADPRPAATSNYTYTASGVTTGAPGTVRCLRIQFTDTSTGSAVPSAMSTNGVGVTFDTANTNYIPTPASWTLNKPAQGLLTLTNATGEVPASASARRISINGITNANLADTRFWLKFSTYSNVDCSTGPVDSSTTLFILTNGSLLSLTVEETLSFSVNAVGASAACDGTTTTAASTATTIPFGTVTAATNAVVCQDLTAATNATNGYTIFARNTGQPANALAQTIANHSGTNAAPSAFSAAGVEAYGYTTNDATLAGVNPTANRFTSPTQGWASMTTTNAELAFEPAGVTSTTYRVGHQVGVSLTTRPGTYTTTVIYTCTPIY